MLPKGLVSFFLHLLVFIGSVGYDGVWASTDEFVAEILVNLFLSFLGILGSFRCCFNVTSTLINFILIIFIFSGVQQNGISLQKSRQSSGTILFKMKIICLAVLGVVY
jgi:hypothetical protein